MRLELQRERMWSFTTSLVLKILLVFLAFSQFFVDGFVITKGESNQGLQVQERADQFKKGPFESTKRAYIFNLNEDESEENEPIDEPDIYEGPIKCSMVVPYLCYNTSVMPLGYFIEDTRGSGGYIPHSALRIFRRNFEAGKKRINMMARQGRYFQHMYRHFAN